MASKKQPDLFGDPPPAAQAQDLRIVRGSHAALGKAQAKFNRLLGEVQRTEKKLSEWRGVEARHSQRVAAELMPLVAQMGDERRSLILLCGEILDGDHGGATRKAERRQLTDLLLDLCEAHLSEDGEVDPSISDIYDRFAQDTWADQQRDIQEALRDEVEGLFGIDITVDADDESFGDFVSGLFGQDDPEDGGTHDTTSGKRRGKKRDGGDTTEDAALAAKKSLREVYRKLASTLHPDRGNDDDRDHRSELMQRANQAYERDDLVELLKLQLDINQIDEGHLATIPESRLEHYNRMLRNQVSSLKTELADITDRFRMVINHVGGTLTTALVEADFEASLQQAAEGVDAIREDCKALRSPAERRVWLKRYEKEKREATQFGDLELFFDDEDLMREMQAFIHSVTGSRKQGTKAKRKKRRR